MRYAPHMLQRLHAAPLGFDAHGHPLAQDPGEWRDVCRCRRDHAGDNEVSDADGRLFRPRWTVVCEGNAPAVFPGDQARVVDPATGSVLAQGRVRDTRKLNLLPYSTIYL